MGTPMKAYKLNRAKQRGAAMVEAIVVMTTMLCFLGMNIYAQHAYGGKVDQMNSTRRDALFWASHNCDEKNGDDGDTYTDPALKDNESYSGGSSSLSLKGLIGMFGGGGSAPFDIFATARVKKNPTTIYGQAIMAPNVTGAHKESLKATIGTPSAVGCNEKAYYNFWTQIFEFGWDFIKGLIG